MIDEKKLIEERPEWLNPDCVGEEEYNKGWNACNKYWCNTIKRQPKVGEWIPCSERLPENAQHKGAFCPKYQVMTKYGVTEGWYNPDNESWYVLFWFMTARFLETDIDIKRGDVPEVVKIPLKAGIVTAWMPLPEPYKGESV